MEFPEKIEYFKKNKDGTKERMCSYREHPGGYLFFLCVAMVKNG